MTISGTTEKLASNSCMGWCSDCRWRQWMYALKTAIGSKMKVQALAKPAEPSFSLPDAASTGAGTAEEVFPSFFLFLFFFLFFFLFLFLFLG